MKDVKIAYFGMTGQGKSLNGCFVLNKPDAFKVGDFAEGETNFVLQEKMQSQQMIKNIKY